MPKAPAVEVEASGRAVRVSSPDRAIYHATEADSRGHQADGRGVLRERRGRADAGVAGAADSARALAGRRTAGNQAGDRTAGGEGGRVLPEAGAKGAPDYLESVEVTFPSGRTADEICPTEIAVPVWCAHMGTLTFHPWPVRRDDVDHPDELRLDLDPQPGTTFADAVRVAGVARELLDELGLRGFPKTSGIVASTSMCASSPAGSSSTCATRPSASAASSPGATRA